MKLVVADAHAGLAKAVRRHLPEAPLQRCTVHLQRNVLAKAPQRLRARLVAPRRWPRPGATVAALAIAYALVRFPLESLRTPAAEGATSGSSG